jgi:SP family arabinose:H+ symporter-like MFS transporter
MAGEMSPGGAHTRFAVAAALLVSLGGFLMGFDASVISGVTPYLENEFRLSRLQLGWVVSSLTLAATIAMLLAGPLSDRLGRRPVLQLAALLYATSAILSASAPDAGLLAIARMVGGAGVGLSLIVAPMYIAEYVPAQVRGRMVSFNQLNIVIGISAAFFSNFVIMRAAAALPFGLEPWRLMLGVEILPAAVYFFALFLVPESPRWLLLQGRTADAARVFATAAPPAAAQASLAAARTLIDTDRSRKKTSLAALLQPSLRLVMVIGVAVAVLQQVTGINAVFFYAPMIFEQSGIGRDASFMQAVLVGLVNLLFTLAAMLLIDRLGRRPLLIFGLAGVAASMLTLAWAFGSASYRLDPAALDALPAAIGRDALAGLSGIVYLDETAFREAVRSLLGEAAFEQHASALVAAAIVADARLILVAIIAFVAFFALSIGPVMWVLFSELFPNALRGIAISFVGFVNSTTAFLVVFAFPWELQVIGTAATFLAYGLFAVAGMVFVVFCVPETKGRSLEEIERELVSQ